MTLLEAAHASTDTGTLDQLLFAKGTHCIAACIPARNKGPTIGTIAADRVDPFASNRSDLP